MTGEEVKALLRICNAAGDQDPGTKTPNSSARADLRRGIKTAKETYKRKIGDHLSKGNPRRMWQGIQHLTN